MASEGAADNNNDDDVSPLATADGNISGGPVASTGENQNNTSSQSNNVDDDNRPKKIDKITALQESIDSLSLAMFEALRGLRDAVAPESGNLGGVANSNKEGGAGNENGDNGGGSDFEELMQLYRQGDPETVAMVHRANNGVKPTKREDFIRLHAKMEMEKDTELVKRLAGTVLLKSADIDTQVSELPGMDRTKSQQMEYIEKLLDLNRDASEELEKAYHTAQKRRDLVRKCVRDNTCAALGIVEETD